VAGLELSLAKGEVLGLLGPNGAGKSSTMQMLTGNLAPSAGRILIDGIDLIDEPLKAKRLIGYLPEQPPVHRDLTVDEYLRFAARLHGLPAREVKTAVERAKTRCGLGDVGGRLIGNLSKGYQQRVGIAQAIVHAPMVVVLDEPTVGLDPIQIREIRALIRELGQEHGVILSTHILPEVQAVCDRVQIINRGRTVFADTLAGLADRHAAPVLMAGLAHAPAIDELRGIEGVSAVEPLPEGRFRITHEEDHAFAERLAALAAERGWGLCELTPERVTLEQIFTDLVYRERVEAAA
ncbi:MAG: ATP-binding cassette domain-containing protein, partial [Ectothiorhodospiraceae bacterium]|jgi:ABC-2 type transport system ATP-binding protein|nr:ATP-binding cassette domain-containing protein [Ectothiorhodospiraceae bacterium]